MGILCRILFVLSSKSEAGVSSTTALGVVVLCSLGVIITHCFPAMTWENHDSSLSESESLPLTPMLHFL